MPPRLDEHFLAGRVEPGQMDALWAEGWRHFGPYFFRYSRLRGHTVLPLRVRLAAAALSRSQRRVLGKNQDVEARLRPAFVDAEVEALFERHKARFTHSVPDTVYNFVSPRPAAVPCRCHSLTLHHRGRLVGVSYLDEGAAATSSVYQCFDPDLAPRSLGVLMILLSMRLSLRLGKALYYPGYAYREPSEYDYKKRLPALEYLDWAGGWARLGAPPPAPAELSRPRALE